MSIFLGEPASHFNTVFLSLVLFAIFLLIFPECASILLIMVYI
jgi:hypothetical protein